MCEREGDEPVELSEGMRCRHCLVVVVGQLPASCEHPVIVIG